MTHARIKRAAQVTEMVAALKEHDDRIGLSPLSEEEYKADAHWALDLGMTPEEVRDA